MRIDASGNLLVGTTQNNPTSSGVNVAGQEFSTTGGVRSTVDANPAATFNRKTDDGTIALFRKDGSTVGSIGVESGDNFIIEANATDHAGLLLWGSGGSGRVTPRLNGSEANGTVDLGRSAGRFKDLYLSGGAYLGGTGSANHLDDYEEGTWTPSWTGLGNGSASGTYTKIGRLVHVTALFTAGSTTSIGSKLEASNLPFAAQFLTYSGARYENYQSNSYIGATRVTGSQ